LFSIRQLDAVFTVCHGDEPFPWGTSRPVPSPDADINCPTQTCSCQGVRLDDTRKRAGPLRVGARGAGAAWRFAPAMGPNLGYAVVDPRGAGRDEGEDQLENGVRRACADRRITRRRGRG